MLEFYGVLRWPFYAYGIYDVGTVNSRVQLLVAFLSQAHSARLRVEKGW
jgi:hypothetical protein